MSHSRDQETESATWRERVLVEWNDTAAPFDAEACVHELFERQAERAPDAIAIAFEAQALSYAQVNARANQIAAFLRARGVGPDVRVAICMDRCPDLVIGVLAILKAGGAYVPLDPSYPRERLAFLLKDCGPAIILTHKAVWNAVRDAVGQDATAPLVDVAAVSADSSASNLNRKQVGLRSTHLAYVIYTSGSTGQPKGVMIEHRSIVNLVVDMTTRLSLAPGAVVPAINPFSFDMAGLELHLPLCAGQVILLLSRNVSRDPFALKCLLDRADLAFVQATPSTWRGLLQAGWRARGAPVLCGGEAMPASLAQQMTMQGAKLWNMYGPTETTIWSSAAPVSDPERITIGRPLANTRICILDAALQPVPIGIAGEIYIGGVGVARGYQNRPELTAERFIASPFVAGDRLYRTGDLGRYGSDGDIEFVGRSDSQVKIRGARIELGEIEAVLAQNQQISQSAIVAREDRTGANRLVAYLSPADHTALHAHEVRAWLATKLPDFMIPDLFVVLDRFPLNTNGKLDRAALPAPDECPPTRAQIEEPADEMERLVSQVWFDVLGIAYAKTCDSFFDVGGNSMLMIAVAAKIKERFGVRIDLQKFFAEPTIAHLALQIADAEKMARAHASLARATDA